VIANDRKRSAVEIAQACTFGRRIELLFRRLKHHLKLRTFLGLSPNAVKLQIDAATIADSLLRLAAKAAKTKFDILRCAERVGDVLFGSRRLSRPSTRRRRPIPAGSATAPTPTRRPSAMRKNSPDSRAEREKGAGGSRPDEGSGANR